MLIHALASQMDRLHHQCHQWKLIVSKFEALAPNVQSEKSQEHRRRVAHLKAKDCLRKKQRMQKHEQHEKDQDEEDEAEEAARRRGEEEEAMLGMQDWPSDVS